MFLVLSIQARPLPKKNLRSTPVMGWNSWNTFFANIDENLIKQTAEAMKDRGFLGVGYDHVIVDDAYHLKERDENGKIKFDPKKFPNGFTNLSDYVHSLGFKFGGYNSNSLQTCQHLAGGLGHEAIDAKSFSEEWKIDYLKYDFCYNELKFSNPAPDLGDLQLGNITVKTSDFQLFDGATLLTNGFITGIADTGYAVYKFESPKQQVVTAKLKYLDAQGLKLFNIQVNNETFDFLLTINKTQSQYDQKDAETLQFDLILPKGPVTIKLSQNKTQLETASYEYSRMGDELIKQSRDIVFALCEWGWNRPQYWAQDIGHQWRTTPDITPFPGKAMWFWLLDIYELTINKGITSWKNAYNDPDMLVVGFDRMDTQKNIIHFTLWAVMNAPLIIGQDVRTMSDDLIKIYQNKKIISINQDPLNIAAKRIFNDDGAQILIRPMINDQLAVTFFNKYLDHTKMSFNLVEAQDHFDIQIGENPQWEECWTNEKHFGKEITIELGELGFKQYIVKLK